MLKIIVTILLLIVAAANLVLMWQVFRKLKQSRDEQTEIPQRYVSVRLTFIGLSSLIISIINIVLRLREVLS